MNNYHFNKKLMSHFWSTVSARDFKLGMFRSFRGLDIHVTVDMQVIRSLQGFWREVTVDVIFVGLEP